MTTLSNSNIDLNRYYKSNQEDLCFFHYPFDEMFKFISRNYTITNRLTMISIDNDDSGNRYNNKGNEDIFKQAIQKQLPLKIDCGYLYTNINNKLNNNILLTSIQKELCFDIDISDYDCDNEKLPSGLKSLRVCQCIGHKQVCSECWYLLSAAAIIIDFFLYKILMIENLKILWVYSGNRGIHCWVNNKNINNLSSFSRSSLIDCMKINSDKEIFDALCLKNSLGKLYLELINDFLCPFFENTIVKNNKSLFIKLKSSILNLLKFYYDEDFYNKIEKLWEEEEDSLENWKVFKTLSININNWKQKVKPHLFIIMRLLFIKLDHHVTEDFNHLLKLPFSIHKKTKRLSFPIPFKQIIEFPIESKEFLNQLDYRYHLDCGTKKQCPSMLLFQESKKLLNEWLK